MYSVTTSSEAHCPPTHALTDPAAGQEQTQISTQAHTQTNVIPLQSSLVKFPTTITIFSKMYWKIPSKILADNLIDNKVQYIESIENKCIHPISRILLQRREINILCHRHHDNSFTSTLIKCKCQRVTRPSSAHR